MLKSEKELDGLYGLNSQIRGFGVSRSLKKVGGPFQWPYSFLKQLYIKTFILVKLCQLAPGKESVVEFSSKGDALFCVFGFSIIFWR